MTRAEGDDEEDYGGGIGIVTGPSNEKGRLRFPVFRLKKSWRDGAVGEEVTRYSRDKSWLFGNVVDRQLGEGMLSVLSPVIGCSNPFQASS